MAAHIIHSLRSIVDTNGVPSSGAKIYVYDAGTDTERAIYSDSGLSVPAANPIVCTGGICPLRYTAAGLYKVVVTTSGGSSLSGYNGDNLDTGVAVGSGALPIANGGTAATTKAAARSSLEVPSVSEVADLATDVAELQDTLTGTDATLIAVGTTAQRPVSPAEGQIRRNTTTAKWEAYVAAWDDFLTATGSVATQAQMEAAASAAVFVAPSVLKHHPGVAKAWCLVTVSGGAPTLAAGYNVSSITDNGAGDFTVNFTVAFSADTYAVAGMTGGTVTGAAPTVVSINSTGGRTTSSCRFRIHLSSNGTDTDPGQFHFVFYGDQ